MFYLFSLVHYHVNSQPFVNQGTRAVVIQDLPVASSKLHILHTHIYIYIYIYIYYIEASPAIKFI